MEFELYFNKVFVFFCKECFSRMCLKHRQGESYKRGLEGVLVELYKALLLKMVCVD